MDDGLRCWKAKASEAGSCNFCARHQFYVYVVRSPGPGPSLEVRFCARCRKEFNRQANRAWRT